MRYSGNLNREGRVFALSKGKTVATISGQLQPGEGNYPAIGNPITIEKLNKEELYIFCLIKFVAEAYRGNFDGWLS